MKKLSLGAIVITTLFVTTACNSDNKPKTKEIAAMAKSEGLCCFSNLSDGQQFFPPSTAEIKQVQDAPPAANLLCDDQAETPSNFIKMYQVSNGGKLTVRITDYCVNPRRLELDYDRRHKNTLEVYGKDQQVRDLADDKGLYKGFAIYSPQNKSAYLHVMVDNRFGITIAGVEQTNFTDIFTLFGMIPVDKLAAFKK